MNGEVRLEGPGNCEELRLSQEGVQSQRYAVIDLHLNVL